MRRVVFVVLGLALAALAVLGVGAGLLAAGLWAWPDGEFGDE